MCERTPSNPIPDGLLRRAAASLVCALLLTTIVGVTRAQDTPAITADSAARLVELATWEGMAFTPDQITFNADLTGFVTTSEAGELGLWSVGPDAMPVLIDTTPAVRYALHGDQVVWQVSADEPALHIRDLASGREMFTLEDAAPLTELALNSDGTRLAYVTQDETIAVWDIAAQERVLRQTLDGAPQVRALAFLPTSGDLLIQTAYSSGITLYTRSFDDRSRDFFLQTGVSAFAGIAVSADGSTVLTTERFYSGGENGFMSLTHAWNPRYAGTFEGGRVGFLPSGLFYSSVAVGSSNRLETITLRDPATLAVRATFAYGGDVPTAAWGWSFSPDGARLVTVTWNYAAEGGRSDLNTRAYTFWDVEAQRTIATSDPIDSAAVMAFSPDSSVLATDARQQITLWDTGTGELLTTLTGHSGPVTHLLFSADGTRLVSLSEDQTIRVWGLPGT